MYAVCFFEKKIQVIFSIFSKKTYILRQYLLIIKPIKLLQSSFMIIRYKKKLKQKSQAKSCKLFSHNKKKLHSRQCQRINKNVKALKYILLHKHLAH